MASADFPTALGHYESFLAEVGDDHPLRFLALEGKGLAQEGSGDLEAALATFQEIAPTTSDYYRPMALYHQGRVLEALERTDEAVAIYTQYFEEFPAAREEMATPMVRDRLAALDPEFAARLPPPPGSPIIGGP
jgi:tetratricopeptide (TPR) repeat protein